MNKTFQEMYTDVGSELQDSTTTMAALIKKFLNRRYTQVLRAKNWDIKRLDYTFDTVAGQSDYTLPRDFGKDVYALDTTNSAELSSQDIQFVVSNDPSRTSGTATNYSIFDARVSLQPSAASVITAVSSSPADSSQVVLIRGVSGGVEQTESITLNGTTGVSTAKQFTRVLSVSKDAATTGLVTVTAGTVTVAVLDPEVKAYRIKKVRLSPTPAGVVTIAMPYVIKPLPMSNDDDIPIIDCDEILECGARADCWRYKRQFQKAAVEEVNFRLLLDSLIYDSENSVNQVPQFLPTGMASAYNRDLLV